ncbi:MAG: hypothetical protein AAGC55_24045 [Myxococcota bacterium]
MLQYHVVDLHAYWDDAAGRAGARVEEIRSDRLVTLRLGTLGPHNETDLI